MRSPGLVSVFIAIQIAMPVGLAAATPAVAQPTLAAPASAVNPQPPGAAGASSASVSPTAGPGQQPSVVGHVDAGRRLYSAICIYCHHLDDTVSDVGAPGLKNALRRHDAAWIGRWLADPQGFADSDASARALIVANPYGLVMPAFPAMQDAQNRADVIAFLRVLGNMSKEQGQPAQ